MIMSYPSWLDQPTTPPYIPLSYGDMHNGGAGLEISTSATDLFETYGDDFSLPTPVKSPIRQHGPLLLPKIRPQDQDMESSPPQPPPPPRKKHRKALSCNYNPPASSVLDSSPISRRHSMSPVKMCDMLTMSPVSGPSSTAASSWLTSSAGSSPASSTRSSIHVRRASESQIDEHELAKYCYPTWRQMPAYITPMPLPAPAFLPSAVGPMASTFIPPVPLPAPPALCSTSTVSATATTEAMLPLELLDFDAATPTTTMLAHLTAPNPSPALVRQINMNAGRRAGQTHFWWDVRNLRPWSDFSLASIDAVPGLMRLLTIEVPQTALPAPPPVERARLQPETEAALHELYRDFYTAKINAALRVAQGAAHMVMRLESGGSAASASASAAAGTANGIAGATGCGTPYFVSNYPADAEKTVAGDVRRGRVVGLVKPFDRWNTGMRAEGPHRKVAYLAGLAHLHRLMREHGCRYGFIVTEIELVCVRCGGPPGESGAPPFFGLLELAAPIRLQTTGLATPTTSAATAAGGTNNTAGSSDGSSSSSSSSSGLTACVALWYLHMLAKEVPLPGQPGWKMDVGGPAACTRQKCLPQKDAWMPEPQLAEKREAKRSRGYVFCTDPLHRRELPRTGRRRMSIKK